MSHQQLKGVHCVAVGNIFWKVTALCLRHTKFSGFCGFVLVINFISVLSRVSNGVAIYSWSYSLCSSTVHCNVSVWYNCGLAIVPSKRNIDLLVHLTLRDLRCKPGNANLLILSCNADCTCLEHLHGYFADVWCAPSWYNFLQVASYTIANCTFPLLKLLINTSMFKVSS